VVQEESEPRWPGPLRLGICQRFQRRGNGFACPGPAKDSVDVPATCTALRDCVLIVPPRLDVIITGAPSALIDDLYVAKSGLDETGARMRARLICDVACVFDEPYRFCRGGVGKQIEVESRTVAFDTPVYCLSSCS